ncbi:hypothetical protein ACOME3_004704 [Neoechinorhynchus agilis]
MESKEYSSESALTSIEQVSFPSQYDQVIRRLRSRKPKIPDKVVEAFMVCNHLNTDRGLKRLIGFCLEKFLLTLALDSRDLSRLRQKKAAKESVLRFEDAVLLVEERGFRLPERVRSELLSRK